MRKKLLIVLFVLTVQAGWSQPLSPRQLFPGLFEAVQLSGIFPDNKIFVDATAKRAPSLILNDYILLKDKPGFDLKQFVTNNFTMPGTDAPVFKTDVSKGIRSHIDTLWHVLARRHDTVSPYSSLLPLPYDFIIPGGRFREIYYWDSYFTMLGLHESHKATIIKEMVGNFAYLIDTYGFIPNGTRTYYLTRSQPPFFSMMIELLAKDAGLKTYTEYQPELLKEYAFWMNGAEKLGPGEANRRVVRMPDYKSMRVKGVKIERTKELEFLNRYWDDSDLPREESFKQDVETARRTTQKPGDFFRNIRAAAESGWDFSTRWMDSTAKLENIETTDIIPVDLNCLLYHLEQTIAKSYQLQGKKDLGDEYLKLAEMRKKAILKYCWNENEGWFLDYNWKQGRQMPEKTLAGVFALTFNVATPSQAIKVGTGIRLNFFKPGGLITTLVNSGQQWDSPNAWAPLQYMAITGLNNYEQAGLARAIAQTWAGENIRVFNATGKLMEKYNALDINTKAGGGEYPLQDGFGWTNGVLLNLMNHYHIDGL